ncbi:MAG TPA: GNAT family N-acetyltransferase [Ktedonobacterales bacterium]|nr:GNAT family N-acetyltransferase [Ktedonobacterales bacterium]
MATNDAHASADAGVAAYWASFLGCAPERLETPGTWVGPHSDAGLADYRGVYLLRRGESCVVSVPAPLLAMVTEQLAGLPATSSFDSARLQRLFGDAIERFVGPAWQGFLRADDFRPVARPNVRQLTAADAPALRRLEDACGEQEWEHSGIGGAEQVTFGAFAGDRLVAAGMGEPLAATLLHIGIITHPDERGQGHGRAVVSAISAYALGVGLVPRYQTLAANTPSVAIARALGFTHYATTLAVRLARLDI